MKGVSAIFRFSPVFFLLNTFPFVTVAAVL